MPSRTCSLSSPEVLFHSIAFALLVCSFFFSYAVHLIVLTFQCEYIYKSFSAWLGSLLELVNVKSIFLMKW